MPVPRVVVLGVPTSAGAHHAGQDLAPAALRAHRFTEHLAAAGIEVEDGGTLAGEVFTVDHGGDARSRWGWWLVCSAAIPPPGWPTSTATPIWPPPAAAVPASLTR